MDAFARQAMLDRLKDQGGRYPMLEEVPRAVIQGDPHPHRQSEYYPPWERDNPRPGQTTVELYGERPKELVNAEMLHYLGAVDPRNGQAVDPWLRYLKEQMTARMPAGQMQWERGNFEREREGPQDTFQDWWDRNRSDAYMRAYLYPEMGDPGWQRAFNPQIRPTLEALRGYVQQPRVLPGGGRS